MKKYIVLILSVLSFSANAESVNLEEMTNFENQTRERFSPPDVVKQLIVVPTCNVVLTNEKNGKITRTTLKLIGQHTQNNTEHTYHDEDNTGSTTVWFDSRTGKGQISIMDTNQVVASGNVSNCK